MTSPNDSPAPLKPYQVRYRVHTETRGWVELPEPVTVKCQYLDNLNPIAIDKIARQHPGATGVELVSVRPI